MKVAIMQPYFIPYLGYWQLIKAVDTFIIYDDVNFIRGGGQYINRNNILVNKNKVFFRIEISNISQNKLINETHIDTNNSKYKNKIITIKNAYKKAPHFDDIFPLIVKILEFKETNISLFLKNSIDIINNYLGINTEIIFSSSIKKDNSLKAENKILDICKNLNATQYINTIGGQDLYSYSNFKSNNIDLSFIKMNEIRYKQFDNEFIPNLSIIDVMMFNSKEDIQKMLESYTLITS